MRPNDLPTNETLQFVVAHTLNSTLRILEVGCGNGELALRLQSLGFQVTAIDSSAEAVQQAKQLGIDARLVEWPDFDEKPFDAILFTRSLHHIHPLPESLKQAKSLLRQSGQVIVEDFAFDEVTRSTVEWFYSELSLLDTCDKLNLEEDSFPKNLLLGGGDFQLWWQDHDRDLNPAPVMLTQLRDEFQPIIETSAPYLYRYTCPLLEVSDKGYEIAVRLLEAEKRMADVGAIDLIGRRFVGRKREKS